MTIDCLVLGHLESSLDEMAERLRSTRESSGGFTEIETNSVLWDGRRLSYSELFNALSRETYDIDVTPTPFNAPHAGAIFLANRLRGAGIEAVPISYISHSLVELDAALAEHNPRVVVVTTTYYVEDSPLRKLIDHIRRVQGSALIVVGGPFVTARTITTGSGEAGLARLGADVYVLDPQGEQALIGLVSAHLAADPLDGVPNLMISDGAGGLTTSRREKESNDLDGHRIEWATFEQYLKPKVAFVRSARGCAFSCAFCNYPTMSGGHIVASVSTTCDELEALRSLGVRDIAFVDDTFNVPLPRFKQLLTEIIRRDLDIRWTSFFRCSNADEEAFDLMAASGCAAVFLGVESGDPRILKLMNKAAQPKSYARGIKALTERGILTMGSFIIGFPGESTESVQCTLQFLSDNPTTFHNFQLYYHDRLAPVERLRESLQIVGSGYTWEHENMEWHEAADWVRHAMSLSLPSSPIPLYGFSIWSLPYLQSLGMSRSEFTGFTRLAGEALRQSVSDGVDRAQARDSYLRVIGKPLVESMRSQLHGDQLV